MDKIKIYLCIPYSYNPEESFNIANRIAAELFLEGKLVYSPISHCHPIAKEGKLETNYEFWKDMDESMIDWCDQLMVVMLDNWRNSNGVIEEIKYAKSKNKKILYLNPDHYLSQYKDQK